MKTHPSGGHRRRRMDKRDTTHLHAGPSDSDSGLCVAKSSPLTVMTVRGWSNNYIIASTLSHTPRTNTGIGEFLIWWKRNKLNLCTDIHFLRMLSKNVAMQFNIVILRLLQMLHRASKENLIFIRNVCFIIYNCILFYAESLWFNNGQCVIFKIHRAYQIFTIRFIVIAKFQSRSRG